MLSGKYECFCCGEVFDDSTTLRRHERENHSRREPDRSSEGRDEHSPARRAP